MILKTKYSLFLILNQFLDKYAFCVNFYLHFIVEIEFLNSSHYSHTSLLKMITLKLGVFFIWTSNSSKLETLEACLPQIEHWLLFALCFSPQFLYFNLVWAHSTPFVLQILQVCCLVLCFAAQIWQYSSSLEQNLVICSIF